MSFRLSKAMCAWRISLVGVTLVVAALGAEPECNIHSCLARNPSFADAHFMNANDLMPDGLFNFLLPSLCSRQNWKIRDQCLLRCPWALVVTQPALPVRGCLLDNGFTPYEPIMHVDSKHPLVGQELELVAMATEGSAEREACDFPNDGKNYSGKIAIVKRGGCRFDRKANIVGQLGAVALIIVDYLPSNDISLVMLPIGTVSEDSKIPIGFMPDHFGSIILKALDTHPNTTFGKMDMDCSIMDEPAPEVLPGEMSCPSRYTFGMCSTMKSEKDMLCERCPNSMRITDPSSGEVTTSCLYDNSLLPRTSKLSFFSTQNFVQDTVHLALLVPGFGVDELTCKDKEGYVEPLSGLSCVNVAQLIESGLLTSCAYLFTSFLYALETVENIMQNCLKTCPRSAGGVGCPGGTGEGCAKTDFENAHGKIVAVPESTGCQPYQVLRNAEMMGVRGVIMLTTGAFPILVDGLSEFITVPVHALDKAGSEAFESQVRALHMETDGQITGMEVTFLPTELPPINTSTPPPVREVAAVVLEEKVEFEFDAPTIVLMVLAGVLVVGVGAAAVKLKLDAATLHTESDRFTIPLSAASMSLSLSLLLVIAVVVFVLTHRTGKQATDAALDDGWTAVDKTHINAVASVSQLTNQLLDSIIRGVGAKLGADLHTGAEAAQVLAKLFMFVDGSWETFERMTPFVTELSDGRGTLLKWNLAVRTTSGFYAQRYLMTDDRPNSSRQDGQAHINVTNDGTLYGTNVMVYASGGNAPLYNIPRVNFDPMKNLGRQWLDANERVSSLKQLQVTCTTVFYSSPVPQDLYDEFGSRPLSCLSPLHNQNGDFIGSTQSYIDAPRFGTILGEAVTGAGAENMSLVVFNDMGHMITSSIGRISKAIDTYLDLSFLTDRSDAMTEPIQFEYSSHATHNAAACYMKSELGMGDPHKVGFDFDSLARRGGAAAGEFDQKKWYGRGLSTRFVNMYLDFEGGKIQDRSSEGWEFGISGTPRFSTGARGTEGSVELDGASVIEMYLNLTTTIPRVRAQRDPNSPDFNPVYNSTRETPAGSRVVFEASHPYIVLGQSTPFDIPLLREPLVSWGTFSIAMWVKPLTKIDSTVSGASPQLFADTLDAPSTVRLYANGALEVRRTAVAGYPFGCRTRPVPGGLPVGEWSHVVAVVDRQYKKTDAKQMGRSVHGLQDCAVYVNGQVHDVTPMRAGVTNDDSLVLQSGEPYLFGKHLKGLLDEVAIFNNTLSPRDIRSIMDMGPLEYSREVQSRQWFLQVRLENNFDLDWAVTALVPRDDIMREVDMLNEQLRYNQTIQRENSGTKLDQSTFEVAMIIVVIMLVSVLFFLFFNAMLTRPFTKFARQMADVAAMKVEQADTDIKSVLREIDAMHAAMTVMIQSLREYKAYIPEAVLFKARSSSIDAPVGAVALVFTDIVGSTRLWEASPDAMDVALAEHNDAVRGLIASRGGYEVKTIGDAFMVAFADPAQAVAFSIEVHDTLISLEWPDEPALCDASPTWAKQTIGSGLVWNGITVRSGVAYGEVQHELNPMTERVDYRGKVVNLAARMESAALPGTTLVSSTCLQGGHNVLRDYYVAEEIQVHAKGIGEVLALPGSPAGLKARFVVKQEGTPNPLKPGGAPVSLQRDRHPSVGACSNLSGQSTFSTNSMGGRSLHRQGESRIPKLAITHIMRSSIGSVAVATSLDDGLCNVADPDPGDVGTALRENMILLITAAARTSGILDTEGARGVVTWNVTAPCGHHMKQAFVFASMLERSVTFTGITSGILMDGSLGTSRQRHVVVVGLPIALAEAAAWAAQKLQLPSLGCFLCPLSIELQRVVRPLDTWGVSYGPREPQLQPAHLQQILFGRLRDLIRDDKGTELGGTLRLEADPWEDYKDAYLNALTRGASSGLDAIEVIAEQSEDGVLYNVYHNLQGFLRTKPQGGLYRIVAPIASMRNQSVDRSPQLVEGWGARASMEELTTTLVTQPSSSSIQRLSE
eukprot:Hpha_TRINITY_DN15664_c4_g4::TRINITY_DN15664_c4_g4_i1::g.101994::m.101994